MVTALRSSRVNDRNAITKNVIKANMIKATMSTIPRCSFCFAHHHSSSSGSVDTKV